MQQPTRLLSNELRDQQEGKATRWAAFFDFQRAVAPCLNGCLFPTALISSCLNCRSLGGAEICLVSKRMFIPDGTPVLVTEYYILTGRNIETLNMVVCSATNVESCLCLKVPRVFLRGKPLQWVKKTTKYRWFYTLSAAKNGRNSRAESGINTPLTVALSWIVLSIVQNGETMGVREGKTSVNWSFYAPKKHFYGCDGSSRVYAGWHRDDITDTVVTFT